MSQTSDQQLVTVLGATGTQGGAVARALLAEGTFAVRGVTRDASSARAQALSELGAEMVEAELTDESSLRTAFDGAYGAFVVTPFWEHRSPERELAEVRTVIAAAQAARPQHVVWSTLEDTRQAIAADDQRMPFLDGYRVPHFDVKGGAADALFAASGLPVTYVLMSFYWDQLLGDLAPQRDEDGTLALHLPVADAPVAGIASDDIGRVVLRVLQQPATTIGATVPAVGDVLTGGQMAAAFTAVLGEPVAYRPLTAAQFRAFPFPGAEELANMFQYYAEFPDSYTGRRDVAAARAVNPEHLSLPDFLRAHGARVPG
ncbi:NmrA/HSCARG family protein [Motilibacter aurantiacus]|uniref:NmrA/HSCARG family protein n=1 Tax=Motilibacter aurantiacus TaxID=2714955 RepID=UPI00140AA3CF|nr:NmrA/HSCARG family protein [Motilibacter aurantiacus]NHC44145.1 NmrA/HSCARG family protein [Motilibacter aurantiacus]